MEENTELWNKMTWLSALRRINVKCMWHSNRNPCSEGGPKLGVNVLQTLLWNFWNVIFEFVFVSEVWWNKRAHMPWGLAVFTHICPASEPHHSLSPLLGRFSVTCFHLTTASILHPWRGGEERVLAPAPHI